MNCGFILVPSLRAMPMRKRNGTYQVLCNWKLKTRNNDKKTDRCWY